MSVSRRHFVVGAAVAGPFAGLLPRAALAQGTGPKLDYGPLAPAVDRTTGEKLISLPDKFAYRSIANEGTVMIDGHTTPGSFDGMECYAAGKDTVRLVRNHETGPQLGTGGPGAPAGSNPYDPACNGGTTTIEVDMRGGQRKWHDWSSWSSLTGTYFNCSGGASPYGTWFSCEELPGGSDLGPDFFGNGEDNLTQKHGYVYEVDSAWGPGENPVPTPITQAGRFTHEGAVLDRRSGIMYMTQDDFFGPSGLYRYIPPNNAVKDGKVEDGGTLEMLRVIGIDNAKLYEHQQPGARYQVDWVPIPDPDPSHPQGTDWFSTLSAVSSQGHAQGAAMFSRLEGIRQVNRKIYFSSTQGGQGRDGASSTFGPGHGQIWVLNLNTMRLRLVFEAEPVPLPITPDNQAPLSLPDNIAISPQGALVMCEDGTIDRPDRGVVKPSNFIRGLGLDGTLFDFAENLLNDSEFTGACFSPDGQSLFVNIQSPGHTLEIRGPFQRGPW